eukprot:m.821495 g.821495  ORF g.821495 m.821495 type:complete len:468 (+) comp23401_c0_seq1:1361-2764(+)
MWPRSRSTKILCSHNLQSALNLAAVRIHKHSGDMLQTITDIVHFAKAHPDKIGSCMSGLLAMTCNAVLLQPTRAVLELMLIPIRPHDYGWKNIPRSVGIFTPEHATAICRAIHTFTWKDVADVVTRIVAATDVKHAQYCVQLALDLLRANQSDAVDAVGVITAKIVLGRTLQTLKCDDFGLMLFQVQGCKKFRDPFVDRSAELAPDMLAKTLKKMNQTFVQGDAISAFPKLFHTYLKATISPTANSATMLHHALQAFELTLDHTDYVELQKAFVKAVLDAGQPSLIEKLVQHRPLRKFTHSPHIRRLIAARIAQLDTPKPIKSNRQPNATVPGHAQATSFLRSDEVSTTIGGFNGIANARKFVRMHFSSDYNSVEHHSARAVAGGTGKNVHVTLTKAPHIYSRLLMLWNANQAELSELRQKLQTPVKTPKRDTQDQPATQPPEPKVRRVSPNADSTEGGTGEAHIDS